MRRLRIWGEEGDVEIRERFAIIVREVIVIEIFFKM